jgi:hypothetical protein
LISYWQLSARSRHSDIGLTTGKNGGQSITASHRRRTMSDYDEIKATIFHLGAFLTNA